MRLVPKAQYGRQLIAQSDNTRVAKPAIERKIEYKLKPGEFFFTNRNTGKKTLIKPKNGTISADRRSTYQRQQDQIRAKQFYRQYKEDKKYEEGMRNLQGFLTFSSPSTWVGAATRNNGRSYFDNVASGEGFGNDTANLLFDLTTPLAANGIRNVASSVTRYSQNVGKRAVETAMRTTPYANPIPEISNNFHIMLQGNNGGRTRLFHIGNYILTGKRTGPKGYYNSFAPFVQLNSSFTNRPGLKSRIKAFTQPKGVSYAFSGHVDSLGQVLQYTGGNDIIDAFLYGSTIDPKYGVLRVNPDYRIHTDYINKWYPNKKIQVYEVQNSSGIPEDQVTFQSSWAPSNEFSQDFGTNYNNILNAAGHLKQTGIYNGCKVIRRQDIWKFNPTEYKQKWFENRKLYTDEPLWKKKLLDSGLRYVDRIGTPVITRTKWVYE